MRINTCKDIHFVILLFVMLLEARSTVSYLQQKIENFQVSCEPILTYKVGPGKLVINRICDGVEAETRKSQACFQII